MVTPLLQSTFHGVAVDAGLVGHVSFWIVRLWMPSEMLKVLSYSCEAVLTIWMMLDVTLALAANWAVYVQSVAMPTSATLRADGQPVGLPMVDDRLTPAELPPRGAVDLAPEQRPAGHGRLPLAGLVGQLQACVDGVRAVRVERQPVRRAQRFLVRPPPP